MHAQAVNTQCYSFYTLPFGGDLHIVHAYTTHKTYSLPSGVCNNKLFASESVSQTLSGKRERGLTTCHNRYIVGVM